jgi:hypothetical protein
MPITTAHPRERGFQKAKAGLGSKHVKAQNNISKLVGNDPRAVQQKYYIWVRLIACSKVRDPAATKDTCKIYWKQPLGCEAELNQADEQ